MDSIPQPMVIKIEDDGEPSKVIDLDTYVSIDDKIKLWHGKVKKSLNSLFDIECVAGIENLMKWYIQTLNNDFLNTEINFNFLLYMKKHMYCIYHCFKTLNWISAEGYLENMETILALYLDSEGKVFTKDIGKQRKILKQTRKILLGILNTYLLDQNGRIYHVLLKMKLNTYMNDGKTYFDNLLRVIFSQEPKNTTDAEFCCVCILFQKWKKFYSQEMWEKLDKILQTKYFKEVASISSNTVWRQISSNNSIIGNPAQLGDETSLIHAYFNFIKSHNVEDKVDTEKIDLDSTNLFPSNDDEDDEIDEFALLMKNCAKIEEMAEVNIKVEKECDDDDCIIISETLQVNPEEILYEIIDDEDIVNNDKEEPQGKNQSFLDSIVITDNIDDTNTEKNIQKSPVLSPLPELENSDIVTVKSRETLSRKVTRKKKSDVIELPDDSISNCTEKSTRLFEDNEADPKLLEIENRSSHTPHSTRAASPDISSTCDLSTDPGELHRHSQASGNENELHSRDTENKDSETENANVLDNLDLRSESLIKKCPNLVKININNLDVEAVKEHKNESSPNTTNESGILNKESASQARELISMEKKPSSPGKETNSYLPEKENKCSVPVDHTQNENLRDKCRKEVLKVVLERTNAIEQPKRKNVIYSQKAQIPLNEVHTQYDYLRDELNDCLSGEVDKIIPKNNKNNNIDGFDIFDNSPTKDIQKEFPSSSHDDFQKYLGKFPQNFHNPGENISKLSETNLDKKTNTLEEKSDQNVLLSKKQIVSENSPKRKRIQFCNEATLFGVDSQDITTKPLKTSKTSNSEKLSKLNMKEVQNIRSLNLAKNSKPVMYRINYDKSTPWLTDSDTVYFKAPDDMNWRSKKSQKVEKVDEGQLSHNGRKKVKGKTSGSVLRFGSEVGTSKKKSKSKIKDVKMDNQRKNGGLTRNQDNKDKVSKKKTSPNGLNKGSETLPLKKRKHSVTNSDDEMNKISYPAKLAMGIAEILETRTFKTPAQKKQMPHPLPTVSSQSLETEQRNVVTDHYNNHTCNNHTYNNPTMNYHMNKVSYPFFPSSSLTYFSPIVPLNSTTTFDVNMVRPQQQPYH